LETSKTLHHGNHVKPFACGPSMADGCGYGSYAGKWQNLLTIEES
jgi:hypothetical protein